MQPDSFRRSGEQQAYSRGSYQASHPLVAKHFENGQYTAFRSGTRAGPDLSQSVLLKPLCGRQQRPHFSRGGIEPPELSAIPPTWRLGGIQDKFREYAAESV